MNTRVRTYIYTRKAHTTWLAFMLTVLFSLSAKAQDVALRNNLLYDVTLTPNLGAELHFDSLRAATLHVGWNAWDIDKEQNKKWRHFIIAPGLRRYRATVCDTLGYMRRSQYLEANLIYSHFNVGNTKIPFGLYDDVRHHRLQGDLIALGAKYGWQWRISPLFLFEAEAGLAVGYAWFKKYDCPHCGTYLGRDSRPFLMPILGLNIVLDKRRKDEERRSDEERRTDERTKVLDLRP